MTVNILLTIAGTDTGPFLLFSDVDGFTSAFESGIPKVSLTYPGYTTSLVPNGTTIIRVRSVNEKCNNYTDIPVTSQSCKCITFTSNNSFAGNYTYTQCSTGTPVTAIIPAFGIINVCGSDPSVNIEAVDITFGGSCATNDECDIPPPPLFPQRCTATVTPTNYYAMEKRWYETSYGFTLNSFILDGIEYATGQDIIIYPPGDLVVGVSPIDGLTYVMNINDWLNGILFDIFGSSYGGWYFYDNMKTIDKPDASSTLSIEIHMDINGFNYGDYYYLSTALETTFGYAIDTTLGVYDCAPIP